MPWEFLRLTPREYRLKTHAFERREQRLWQMVAQVSMHIMAPHWNRKKHGPLRVHHAVGFNPNPMKYLKRS